MSHLPLRPGRSGGSWGNTSAVTSFAARDGFDLRLDVTSFPLEPLDDGEALLDLQLYL
jgi:hypothetical protein